MKKVALVNTKDELIGEAEKLFAHQEGLLHRAFSILIFNDKNELLIHKRADSKYHSGGLWTNTCCSHPEPGEDILESAERRLNEEMGLSTDLQPLYHFIYRAELDNGLIEHELDHVLIGWSNESPIPDPDEASDWKYVSLEQLKADLFNNPNTYTFWFREIINAFGNSWYL